MKLSTGCLLARIKAFSVTTNMLLIKSSVCDVVVQFQPIDYLKEICLQFKRFL
jgi:hypothetical protein